VVAFRRLTTVTARRPGTRLTAREREIASLLGRGLTNKEIAQRLKISQRTADTHIQNMLNKLGASNRAQIVALAGEAPALAEAVAAPATSPTPAAPRRRVSLATMATLLAGAVISALLLSADRQAGLVEKAVGKAAVDKTEAVINDPLDGSRIDPSIWTVNGGPGIQVYENDGRLSVHVRTDAQNAFVAGVFTVCRARGDFNAQVSFDLAMWPRLNALWIELGATGTPFGTYRTSRDYTDNYGVYFPPTGMEVGATGSQGLLRLSRSGSKWSGYFLDGDHWSLLGSGEGPKEDVGLNLILANDQPPFGGGETLVYFRNFRLTADRIVCP
jgi:DNA-binding CsgD family transcriptional regulator